MGLVARAASYGKRGARVLGPTVHGCSRPSAADPHAVWSVVIGGAGVALPIVAAILLTAWVRLAEGHGERELDTDFLHRMGPLVRWTVLEAAIVLGCGAGGLVLALTGSGSCSAPEVGLRRAGTVLGSLACLIGLALCGRSYLAHSFYGLLERDCEAEERDRDAWQNHSNPVDTD